MGIQTVTQALDNEGRGSPYGFKNRVHNGAMLVHQRGVTTSTTGGYALDRFYALQGTSGTFTATQSSEAPIGFSKSLVFTVGSAGTASAAQQVRITQAFEGLNMADLDWGKSTAKTLTVSFWVRSSVTGTYCVAIHNDGGNRAYIREYTISSANTWEQKSVTIPGCIDGTWPVTNGRWGTLKFDLGSGSDRLGTAGSWLSGAEYAKTSNQVNFINNAGATFYLTGIQVEIGSQSTSFDYRSYPSELAICQRYYAMIANSASGSGNLIGTGTVLTATRFDGIIPLPVSMRSTPSLVCTIGTNYYRIYVNNNSYAATKISFNECSASNSLILFYNNTDVSGLTQGQAGWVEIMSAGGYIAADSEL